MQDRAPDILLVTGADAMPVPDPESGLLVAALADLDIRATLEPWDGPAQWSRSPLVVLRTPWDYIDRPDDFLAFVLATAAITTVVNDPDVVAWNIHKGYLAELAATGVPVVPTAVVRRGASSAAQHAALNHFPRADHQVIKPAISAGAHRAIRTPAASPQAQEHLAGLVAGGDALVQPYVPEIEQGEVSLVYLDGALSHALRKVPKPGDFRVHEEYGGSVVPHTPTDGELAVGAAVLRAAPAPTIYARIDLVTTAVGPLLMEAELIDPELFLRAVPDAAARYASLLKSLLA